ncbi:MAG TPA: hypothetical protein VN706_18395 [Gemmatimonadaceae bacterium]|nr:hypothetical protein [Gemmatimonadaceae bacterium]
MFRFALVFLAAPIIAAGAQGVSGSAVRVEVSADGYRVQPAADSARAANGGERAPAAITGAGKFTYALASGDEVTIAATTANGRVHVEVKDETSVLGLADAHTVTIRNRNGVISFEVQRMGALHFKYGTIF